MNNPLFSHRQVVPPLTTPLNVALIGAGYRSTSLYEPTIKLIGSQWVKIVAVCDPVKANCDRLAALAGVPAYYDIRKLVKDRPMEAAVVVAPIPSHHSISVYLSSHGIHNLIETAFSSMYCQSLDMVQTGKKNNVVVRVAENFFRMAIDRFAQAVRDSKYIGDIKRILCYADHFGYHNNSRWISFAKSHPLWVQGFEHQVSHPAFFSQPQRRKSVEALSSSTYGFPDDFVVLDIGSGHGKGHLGRMPRPGLTEWQGTRGTLTQICSGARWAEGIKTEIRRVSDDKLEPAQQASGNFFGGGNADQVSLMKYDLQGDEMHTCADTPDGRIEFVSGFRHLGPIGSDYPDWYVAAITDHLSDFALAVRGIRQSEFDDRDALASEMMSIGAEESALQESRRIKLPLEGDLEVDALERRYQKEKFGVDPLDVEAMLSISYPRP